VAGIVELHTAKLHTAKLHTAKLHTAKLRTAKLRTGALLSFMRLLGRRSELPTRAEKPAGISAILGAEPARMPLAPWRPGYRRGYRCLASCSSCSS
jgi:hypothetical protein